MRILIVTRNLPPLVGGMERLNWHMAEELAKVAEVRVIGPAGSAALAPEGVPVREAPLKPLWKFLLRARALARREARTFEPDLVLAGSGLTAPIARSAAQTCGARTAVYVHGLDVAVRNFVYRTVWLPAIRRMDRVIANSHATAQLCRDTGVEASRIGIVHPGVDLPEDTADRGLKFPSPAGRGVGGEGSDSSTVAPSSTTLGSAGHSGAGPQGRSAEFPRPSSSGIGGVGPVPSSAPPLPAFDPAGHSGAGPQGRNPESVSVISHADAARAFRQRHNLGDGPLLLSVGRLSTRKGLREFVTQSLPAIVAAQPTAMLVIVGDAPKQALHAQAQTPASIRAAADAAGVGRHIRFLGKISDAELDTAYVAADVHVFPVREMQGDIEGFGMVAVEAAARGLPTVAFSVGGVVDAVADGSSGRLVPAANYEAFSKAVLAVLIDPHMLAATSKQFARSFAWSEFGLHLSRQLPCTLGNESLRE